MGLMQTWSSTRQRKEESHLRECLFRFYRRRRHGLQGYLWNLQEHSRHGRSGMRKKTDVSSMRWRQTVRPRRGRSCPEVLARQSRDHQVPQTAQETSAENNSAGQEDPAITDVVLPSPSRNRVAPPGGSLPTHSPHSECNRLFAALLGVNSGLLAHGSLDGDD